LNNPTPSLYFECNENIAIVLAMMIKDCDLLRYTENIAKRGS